MFSFLDCIWNVFTFILAMQSREICVFFWDKKRAIHNAFLANKNSLLVLLVHVTTAVLYMNTMKLITFSLLQSIRYPPHNLLGFGGPPHIVKVQNTADHVQVSTGDLNRGLKSTYDSNGK